MSEEEILEPIRGVVSTKIESQLLEIVGMKKS